jgi:hypothetical protein
MAARKTARGAEPSDAAGCKKRKAAPERRIGHSKSMREKLRETAARTVCLWARRRLEEALADVVPVRREDCSKVDYCNCPRHMPHSWNWLNFSCCIEDASISEFGAT